ncbi:MAG: type II CAAX endopeptidase family protein [Bacteroidota bacterium]
MGHLADKGEFNLPAWLRVICYILAASFFTFLFYLPFLAILDVEKKNIYEVILSQTLLLFGFASAGYLFYKNVEGYRALPRYMVWDKRFFIWGLEYGFIFISVCGAIMVGANILSFQFNRFYFDLALYFVLMLLVSLTEELAFRGYVLHTLGSSYGRLIGILGSSLLFSLLHLANDNITIIGFISIYLFGVLAALLFYRFSSLWAPIGVHLTWNYTQGSILGFAVSGNERAGIFEIVTHTESDHLTGGAFGMEGSVFLSALLLVAIGREYQLHLTASRRDT